MYLRLMPYLLHFFPDLGVLSSVRPTFVKYVFLVEQNRKFKALKSPVIISKMVASNSVKEQLRFAITQLYTKIKKIFIFIS
jgi:hypothetical protein